MTTMIADVDQNETSTLAWGAVIAGGAVSAAVTLLLLALGVGLGLAAVSPWSDEGVSATTFHVGAGLYLIAIAMLSGTVGGYLAGRLRTKWTRFQVSASVTLPLRTFMSYFGGAPF